MIEVISAWIMYSLIALTVIGFIAIATGYLVDHVNYVKHAKWRMEQEDEFTRIMKLREEELAEEARRDQIIQLDKDYNEAMLAEMLLNELERSDEGYKNLEDKSRQS